MKRLVPLMLLLALVLAACGEKEEPSAGGGELQPFTVVLDYVPNADHAAIYAAQASGEFERAGLDVKLVTPSDPAAPLKQLVAGRADLAISYEPELLLARDRGTNVVSVAALVQKPLTSVMSIEGSGVKAVGDLRGKTIGTAGIPYQDAYLKAILAKAKIPAGDVKTINVGFNLTPAMIGKRVAATLGSFWNVEGVDLQQKGRKPTILKVDQLGVPTYNELIFVANREDLTTEFSNQLRRFLGAVARGAKAVRDNPKTGVDALREAEPSLDAKLLDAQVRATNTVAFPASDKDPWGYMDATEWDEYGLWMLKNELVSKDPRASQAHTNEFLPGQGLRSNSAEPPSEE